MKISNGVKILSVFFFSLFVLLFAQTILAADLNLSPSSGTYHVGDTIKVRIVLSTPTQSANAVSGTLSFSKNLLTLNSISKSGSLISLWAVEPSYSNSAGTANMEGVILNGYMGSNGTILTLSFTAKAEGSANLKFTSSSVLANDGAGTSILSNTGQANFSIEKAVEKIATTPKIGPEKPATVTTTPAMAEPVVVKVLTPQFTDYSKDITEGDFIVVKGLADSSVDIIITSDSALTSSDKILHDTVTVKSNDKGTFAYVSDRTSAGVYMITAQARNKDGVESEKNLPIKISVLSPSSSSSITQNLSNTFSTIIPIIALVVLCVLLLLWAWYKILNYRESLRKKFIGSQAVVSKSFDILDEDVKEEIKIFKKIKMLQPLTTEERTYINQFKKDLDAAERTILDEMSHIKKI